MASGCDASVSEVFLTVRASLLKCAQKAPPWAATHDARRYFQSHSAATQPALSSTSGAESEQITENFAH